MTETVQFEELESNPGLMDVDALNDNDSIEVAIGYHKTKLYEKTKYHGQIYQSKRDMAASFREQLIEIKEEIEFELAQIDALIDKQKIINAAQS